jgi:DnaJ-class molecular chaperone
MMRIDFVSDIACPWCAVGLGALEKALERLAGQVDVEIHFQPFELNPTMPPGGQDLVIQYRIHPEPNWQRDGLNLICEQSVNIWDMILGADITVRTITGSELVTVMPPRTQPRTMMRLRRQGLRDRHGNHGDILVRVMPEIPNDIQPELLEAIEKYRK